MDYGKCFDFDPPAENTSYKYMSVCRHVDGEAYLENLMNNNDTVCIVS